MGESLISRAGHVGAGIVLGLLLATAAWAWHSVKPSLPAVLAPPATKIAGLATETQPCTTVVALTPAAKKKLGLPPALQQDPQASVLTAADVPRTDHPLIATAVLRRDTGVGEIYFTPQARPWLATDRRWLVGGFYTYRDDAAQPVGELLVMVDLLQIKALHLGAMGHLDTTGRRALGVGVWASGR